MGTIFWQCFAPFINFSCLEVSLDDPWVISGIPDIKEPLQTRVIMRNILDFSNGLKNLESL